jgi:hypothetical protein
MDNPHHFQGIVEPVGVPLVGTLLSLVDNRNIGQCQRMGQPLNRATTRVAPTMRWGYKS